MVVAANPTRTEGNGAALLKPPHSLPPSDKFLHHDPVALDIIQIKLDRCGCLGRRHIGRLDLAEDFALGRSRTTRQRRLMRLASLAGLSLLDRRGIAANIAPALPRIECGRMAPWPTTPLTAGTMRPARASEGVGAAAGAPDVVSTGDRAAAIMRRGRSSPAAPEPVLPQVLANIPQLILPREARRLPWHRPAWLRQARHTP